MGYSKGSTMATFLRALRAEAYTASGAVAVRPHRVEVDSSGGAVALTLAAPGAAMVGQPILVTLVDASSGATLQYTAASGSVTDALTAKGDQILLIGATEEDWAAFGSRKNGGAYTQTYSTADRTIAARTAAALTENSGAIGGSNDGDLPDLSGSPSGTDAAFITALIAAVRENATMINALIADSVDTTQGLNAIIDDLQANGLAS